MAATFKSASLKVQYAVGIDGDKQLKQTRTFGNIHENATTTEIEAVKNAITSLSAYAVVQAEIVTTKTI